MDAWRFGKKKRDTANGQRPTTSKYFCFYTGERIAHCDVSRRLEDPQYISVDVLSQQRIITHTHK